MTKRAQFPFSAWLPAAMEAPTPVSALVHSSTLVTAGVYLIVRLYSLLLKSSILTTMILIVGAVTSMFAGIGAIVEYDIKKIIALSTLSQLGFMIIRLGLGYPTLALFHLLTHAMFKALLFICAGILIHFHGHSQDIRQIGGISFQLPVTISAVGVSKFALCALPFISGFYSKDAILEVFFWGIYRSSCICVCIMATALTVMYTVRFLLAAMFSVQRSVRFLRFSEPLIFPTIRLSIGAIVSGAMMRRVLSPFYLESFSPFVKRFFIFLTRLAVVVTVLLWDKLYRFKFRKKVLFFSASGTMLFLRSLSTQTILYVSKRTIKSISKIDQS